MKLFLVTIPLLTLQVRENSLFLDLFEDRAWVAIDTLLSNLKRSHFHVSNCQEIVDLDQKY